MNKVTNTIIMNATHWFANFHTYSHCKHQNGENKYMSTSQYTLHYELVYINHILHKFQITSEGKIIIKKWLRNIGRFLKLTLGAFGQFE